MLIEQSVALVGLSKFSQTARATLHWTAESVCTALATATSGTTNVIVDAGGASLDVSVSQLTDTTLKVFESVGSPYGGAAVENVLLRGYDKRPNWTVLSKRIDL
jgi:hypothetical protein